MSLGCVYFAFCIWYFLGAEPADDLNNQLDVETKSKALNFVADNLLIIEESLSGKRTAVAKPAVQETQSKSDVRSQREMDEARERPARRYRGVVEPEQLLHLEGGSTAHEEAI
ncbi:hypothetical protein BKA67DRAFT_542020 [Truncatella angustata]|uniref:Uncharacterized protein n=1 Tax=Truncatella angustata TaxID=152316 RepID=A0A9P8U8B7_9PEZI|nr:uncharacterized protein BKA67DRAFT_542020 [Truncatella angustata]KAH6645034.1 hypothetical protein BKA67DRAFT_542020 [Truncatella angustata]